MEPAPQTSVDPRAALDMLLHHLNSGPSGHPFADFRVLAAKADIDGLLSAATRPGVVRNHLAHMMGAAACTTDAASPDVVYLRRLEQHVRVSEDNAEAFRASVGEDFLDGFFYQLEEQSFIDCDHFDAVLTRVVALLGRTYTGADAIAGLEPKDYWSRVVSMAAWKYDDQGAPLHLSETKPAFWAAWCERALDSGMTADSEVIWEFAGFDRASCTQDFRTSIAGNAGEGCAAIFDAVVAHRLMAAHLRADGPASPDPTGRRARINI